MRTDVSSFLNRYNAIFKSPSTDFFQARDPGYLDVLRVVLWEPTGRLTEIASGLSVLVGLYFAEVITCIK